MIKVWVSRKGDQMYMTESNMACEYRVTEFPFYCAFCCFKNAHIFSEQALDPVQNEKTITCPFNAFPPTPFLMDHLEDRRRAKVYYREREEKLSIPQNPHPAPHEYRGTSRDTASCWVPLRLPPPHLFPGPSASVRWDFSEQHPGGGGGGGVSRGRREAERGRQGWQHPGWNVQVQGVGTKKIKRRKKKMKKKKRLSRAHTNQ